MAVNEKSRNLCQSHHLTRDLPGNVVLKGLQRHEAFVYSHFSYGRGPFPARIWFRIQRIGSAATAVGSPPLAQMRTGVMNQLHVAALNEGDYTY
jgi:hypothetical protein